MFSRSNEVNSSTFYAVPTECRTFIFTDFVPCYSAQRERRPYTAYKILRSLRPVKYRSSARAEPMVVRAAQDK